MDYARVTPRARNGTTGISIDEDITAGNGLYLSLPDRIAALTVSVHIPPGETAEFAVECSASSADKIGKDGTGGYWDPVMEEHPTYTKSLNKNLCNTVTGVRVRCISASTHINVCFCG